MEQIIDDIGFGSSQKLMDELLNKIKTENSMHKDFSKDIEHVRKHLISKGYFDNEMNFNESHAFERGTVRDIKRWSEKKENQNMILEVADNGKIRLWERNNRYDDPGEPYVVKRKIETAEDDRVLGIPYAQAMAGDRVFIVNGKIFTGWALYFSLSSIKSPEDYARNVDLVFNVPYLFSSLLLKAQLGFGTGFNVSYGSESNIVVEETIIQKFLFNKLKINTRLLVKTGFHLFSYGNSYWYLRRRDNQDPDKITILQPERLKIFLDPMTTKIMFYIYLPPIIGGTTIASYPSDGRLNPNILTGMTLSYPTPIVMHPEDVLHFKINDFTEYPFGFSDVKSCIDPATARLDINILAPLIFKKYTKPMIHWSLNSEGLGPNQIEAKKNEMANMLEDMEPGSDPITTERWTSNIIQVGQQKGDIFNLAADMDTQIFAATGAPETYFKPKGSTDRMISEQDKTFLSRLKVPQNVVGEEIENKLIQPKIYKEWLKKKEIEKAMGESDVVEDILTTYDSWLAAEPKIPLVKWKEIFKQDETQSIANAIALLNSGIINVDRAAMKVGEISPEQQRNAHLNQESLDPLADRELDSHLKLPLANSKEICTPSTVVGQRTPSNYNEQENMEMLRGGLNVGPNFSTNNRNITQTQDPSQLGGSRYAQHKTKGAHGDLQEKHKHEISDNTEIILNRKSGIIKVKT